MTENVAASVVDIEKRANDGNEDVDESEKKKLKTDGAEVVVQVEGQGDAGNDVVQGKLEVLDTTGDQLDEFLKKPDDNVNSGVVEDATECLRQLDAAIGNELKLLGI
ncbi:unnamed protein product [Allacma fusca]|uniref:Uncharacterized protein n=1 Tax=Allacma fusca TaxID=39272 RepID=A0A8J2L3Z8_9HEXA|nr:unnamed protein product [Allacma fusca]